MLQQYITENHRTGTVKACPQPTTKAAGSADAGLSRLVVFAGEYLILRLEVDVSSPHVLTTRRLRVTAVNGCEPGETNGPVCARPAPTPASTSRPQHDDHLRHLHTTARRGAAQDHHRPRPRHRPPQAQVHRHGPDNPEMEPIERSAWTEPPLRGTQQTLSPPLGLSAQPTDSALTCAANHPGGCVSAPQQPHRNADEAFAAVRC